MYFKLISKGCWCGVWREEASQKNGVSPNSVQAFTGGHFKRLSISLREIFSSHNEKSFKNAFPIKFSYLYLQSEGKKIHCFFSISFVCLFITLFYVPILLNMSIDSFPALQECSRRLFWCFRKFRNLPDDCFGTFGISEMFPTAVLAFSEIPKRSRRSF